MAQGSSNPTNNLTKIANTAVDTSTGNASAGTQRVVLASNQPVIPISDNAGSLTVDAPVATPVFVRLSSGSAAVDTIPVSGPLTSAQTLTAVTTVTTVSTLTNQAQMGGQAIAMGTGTRSAGTQRVTIATDDVVPASQSGTWNITNVSGTVSLPTGAATAAKQPALGTAGTASADVITVQGIAGGVAQPVSGTVSLGAGAAAIGTVTLNAETTKVIGTVNIAGSQTLATVTNLAQLGGVAIAMGSGARSTGTQRVTIATDDVVPASQSGTWNIGTVTTVSAVTAITNALPAGNNNIGDVDVASIIPGTGATNLGKAVSDVVGATDVGVAALVVRDDALAALAPADGDYTRLRVNATGRLWATTDIEGAVASTANSSTTVLAGAAVFTGTSVDVSAYAQIRVNVFASHASATNGLSMQFSPDGTNWDHTSTFTVPATSDVSYLLPVSHKFFRVVYTNGATLQTSFRLTTALITNATTGTVKELSTAADRSDFALSTRSVIAGPATPGTTIALNEVTVKSASTAAALTDTSLVTQLLPVAGTLGAAAVKTAITEPAFGTDTALVVQTRDPVRMRPSEVMRDAVDKMRVSTPQSMIDTDFEYGIQPTKWESLCLMNNRPTTFYDPTTGISNTSTNLTLPGQVTAADYRITNLTANVSTKLVTATLSSTLGMTVGTPIFVQGSLDRAAVDGWWIAEAVTGSTVTFYVNNIPNGTAQFDSNKTYFYVGNYFSGSAISIDPSSSIGGTISVDGGGTFTTTVANTFTIGQPIVISGTLGGTGSITGYATGNVYYVIATNGTTTFQLSATSGGVAITTGAGTPTGLTYTKSSVSVSGTTVIIKTSDDHGLRVGNSIHLTGTTGLASGGPINGSWVVTTTPTNDTFTFTTNSTATATSPGVITVAGTLAGSITVDTTGTFTTSAGNYVRTGQAITVTGTLGGTGTISGYVTGNTYYVVYTNGINNFQLSVTPQGTPITTTAGTITGLTFSRINAFLYPRQPGYIEQRPFDGGVQFSNETAFHGYQDIRQTRRYFRYQSGKGIQFSTGTIMKPPFYVDSITSSGTTVTINTKYPHGLLTGSTVVVSGATPTAYNGTFTVTTATPLSMTYTALSVPTSAQAVGFPITVSPGTWYGGSNRIGMFDQQNGFFFEHDGQTLYAVVRKSVEQISGSVTVTQNSQTVTGSGTYFGTQLKPGENIVIRGMSYTVQQIQSHTSMTIYPEYRGQSGSNNIVSRTTDTRVPQSSFNIDTVSSGTRSATNPNGFLLDLSKMQMFYMDYSWYGAGAVRFGFKDQRGEVIMCHRVVNSNVNTEAYMRSGNLPARYETNTLAPNTNLVGSLNSTMTSTAQTLSGVSITGGAGQISCTAADLVVGQRINITGTLAGSPTLTSVTIADTAGNFTCASTTLAVNQSITITGTLGGTGSITGYVTGATYFIIATNGSTTFQLSSTLYGTTPIVTTAGTPTGLTYTHNAIAGYTTGTNYYITATNGSTTATLSTVPPVSGQTQTAVGTAVSTPTGLTYTLPNVIDVADTSLWPSAGTVVLTQTSAVGAYTEYITYTGKSGTSVTIGSRAQAGGVTTPKAFTCRSTSPVNIELYAPQAAQTLSHWGSSVIMDGRYDDDKSLVFNTGLTSTISTPTAGTRYPILSLRLAPSVDNGLTGLLGNREIINRMQLTLASMGAFTRNVAYRIEVLLNPRVTAGVFQPVGGSSLAQFCNHAGVGGAYGGESMYAFYSNSNDTISQDLSQVRDVGSSILGGGTTLNFPNSNLDKYPDGPDIITIVAIPLTSTPSVSLTAITDTAGTFTCSATTGLAIGQTVTITGTPTGGPTLSTVAITGTAGQFSCASASLAVGQYITISGTFGGTGSITGYANPTTYRVSAATATTFTLTTTAGAAIVTTAGTPTGLTYTINPIPGYTSGSQYYIVDTNGRTLVKLAATQLGTTALATAVVGSLGGISTTSSATGGIAARINWTEAQA